jgi:hypothetical protein
VDTTVGKPPQAANAEAPPIETIKPCKTSRLLAIVFYSLKLLLTPLYFFVKRTPISLSLTVESSLTAKNLLRSKLPPRVMKGTEAL